MSAMAAFMPHAYFGQYAPRCRIVREVLCENPMQLQTFESVAQHRRSRFGRKTASPIRSSNPISQFSSAMSLVDPQSDRADHGSLRSQRDGKHRLRLILQMIYEMGKVFGRVWMRYAERGRSDFPSAD